MTSGNRRRPDTGMATLLQGGPAELLREPGEVSSPVLQVILERAAAGSRPGSRTDGHVVCLAIEGGGMRGAVSAGMCVVLEAAGLVGSFDRVYGVSSGALNASATAAGQAAMSATHYQDSANRRVVNPARSLLGRPVVDFDFLFGELIEARKPLSAEGLAHGPEFRALATSLDTLSLRVLSGFADVSELMQAVRSSAALPMLGGEPPVFRGERMTDGGLVEPIPFETAIRERASHVLVLRSRPAGYRKPLHSGVADRLGVRGEAALAALVRRNKDAYNRQAATLEKLARDRDSRVSPVAVPAGTRLIGRLEANRSRVEQALRHGADAMAETILTEPISLCWQPVAYRAGPARAATPMPAAAPLRRPRPARGAEAQA